MTITLNEAPTRPLRIHIIGAPGSGKTTLAKKLATALACPLTELDDIFWMNESGTYGLKRPESERMTKLSACIAPPSWIMEGIYYKWLSSSFAAADYILVLQPPQWLCLYRMVHRHFFTDHAKQSSLRQLIAFFIWSLRFYRKNMPAILHATEAYAHKRYLLKNTRPEDLPPGLGQLLETSRR